MFTKKQKAAKSKPAAKDVSKKNAANLKKSAAKNQKKTVSDGDDFIEEMMMFEMFFDDD